MTLLYLGGAAVCISSSKRIQHARHPNVKYEIVKPSFQHQHPVGAIFFPRSLPGKQTSTFMQVRSLKCSTPYPFRRAAEVKTSSFKISHSSGALKDSKYSLLEWVTTPHSSSTLDIYVVLRHASLTTGEKKTTSSSSNLQWAHFPNENKRALRFKRSATEKL